MIALEQYRNFLASLPPVEAEWFFNALREYRQQRSDAARREISGRYLSVMLGWVEARFASASEAELLDLAQDGNAGLIEAIASFQGETQAEFEEHCHREILEHLARISPAP